MHHIHVLVSEWTEKEIKSLTVHSILFCISVDAEKAGSFIPCFSQRNSQDNKERGNR